MEPGHQLDSVVEVQSIVERNPANPEAFRLRGVHAPRAGDRGEKSRLSHQTENVRVVIYGPSIRIAEMPDRNTSLFLQMLLRSHDLAFALRRIFHARQNRVRCRMASDFHAFLGEAPQFIARERIPPSGRPGGNIDAANLSETLQEGPSLAVRRFLQNVQQAAARRGLRISRDK